MSWTDKFSIKIINEIREQFKVKNLVETGTFMGINARLHSNYFDKVISIEKIKKYYDIAKKKLETYPNVFIYNESSEKFLKEFVDNYEGDEYIIIYLDAHFYDVNDSPGLGKFQVLKELKALKGFKKCIIVVHDFDNNLGHISYDKIPLNFDLLKKDLNNINPDFIFYTNELSSCDIVTQQEVVDHKVLGLEPDFETLDNLNYLWTTGRLTYRGFLYCLPEEKVITGLRRI